MFFHFLAARVLADGVSIDIICGLCHEGFCEGERASSRRGSSPAGSEKTQKRMNAVLLARDSLQLADIITTHV